MWHSFCLYAYLRNSEPNLRKDMLMSIKRGLSLLVMGGILFGAIGMASAVPTFMGSWLVEEGPSWPQLPETYTGQEAAALLFGGSPGDYFISTIDSDPAHINHMAWVSTWGGACGGNFPCGTQVAENFEASTGGLYLNFGDTSAYVEDWARGSEFRNYAFVAGAEAVPEPGTWALMSTGLLGLLGYGWRKRQQQTA
jgi:hypothetical protein